MRKILRQVDKNLYKYVNISKSFDTLKDSLNNQGDYQTLFQNKIQQNLKISQNNIDQYEQLLSNYELLHGQKQDIDLLLQMLNQLQQLSQENKKFNIQDFYLDASILQMINQDINNRKSFYFRTQLESLNIKNQVFELNQTFLQILSEQFQKINQFDSQKTLYYFLQSFYFLDQTSLALKIIEEKFIKPKLKQIIQEYQTSKEQDKFNIFLDCFLKMIEEDLQPFLEIQSEQNNEIYKIEDFDIYQQILQSLLEAFSNKFFLDSFSIAISERFKNNYEVFTIFLSNLKKKFNQTLIEKQQNQNLIIQIQKKWNLNAYFNLKSSQITRIFKEQYQDINNDLCQIVKNLVNDILSPTIFIKDIKEKFIQQIFVNLKSLLLFLKESKFDLSLISQKICQILRLLSYIQIQIFEKISLLLNNDLDEELKNALQALTEKYFREFHQIFTFIIKPIEDKIMLQFNQNLQVYLIFRCIKDFCLN